MTVYRIQITEVTSAVEPTSEWKQLADSGNPYDSGPIYGWVEVTRVRERTREVLTQEVLELDIVAVIRAVNGIKEHADA